MRSNVIKTWFSEHGRETVWTLRPRCWDMYACRYPESDAVRSRQWPASQRPNFLLEVPCMLTGILCVKFLRIPMCWGLYAHTKVENAGSKVQHSTESRCQLQGHVSRHVNSRQSRSYTAAAHSRHWHKIACEREQLTRTTGGT